MREIILILHNVRSLHNVGSIFRTADGAGVKKIYLIGITPEPIDRFGRVRTPLAKVALGAEETIPWEKKKTLHPLIKKLKEENYAICALEQSVHSISYTKLPKKIKKIALVLGAEVEGLPSSVLKQMDYVLEIPMYGQKESLNVSVATGIAVFELVHG